MVLVTFYNGNGYPLDINVQLNGFDGARAVDDKQRSADLVACALYACQNFKISFEFQMGVIPPGLAGYRRDVATILGTQKVSWIVVDHESEEVYSSGLGPFDGELCHNAPPPLIPAFGGALASGCFS